MDKNNIKNILLISQLLILPVVFQQVHAVVLARSILTASDSLDLRAKHGRSTEGVLYDLYSGLLTLNSNGEIEPELAVEWSVSDDSLNWTFKLREDALWSDGVPVTAWDFVYAFRNLHTADVSQHRLTGLYPLLKNGKALMQGLLLDKALLGVNAVDKYTLQIQLEKPVPDFLYHLTRVEAMPLPEHAFAMYGPDFGRDGKIINNGPYLLGGSYKSGKFVLIKNPRYFKKSIIKFDKVHLFIENDQSKLLKMFQAGELDIVEGFDPRQKKWLEKYHPEVVHETPANGLIFLIADRESKKLDDIRVRKAMSYALDTKIIANRIYKLKDSGPCYMPEHLGNNNCQQLASDRDRINSRIEKAKLLMDEAGYAGKKLKVLLHIDDYPGNRYAASAIINMWKIINVETVIVEKGVQSGNSDINLRVWASDGNSTNHFILDFIEMLSQATDHDEVKSYLSQVSEHDPHKNMQIFRQLEETFSTQYSIMPISFLQWRYLVRDDISGFDKPVNGTYPSRWLDRKKGNRVQSNSNTKISPVYDKFSSASRQNSQRH